MEAAQQVVKDPLFPSEAYAVEKGKLFRLSKGGREGMPISWHTGDMVDVSQNALKFTYNGNSEMVEVTPCGQILISKSERITEVNLNKQFKQGIHLWEFYCPLSCYGITIGLKNKDLRKEETFEFSSSTPRNITLKLDMNQKIWKCWINKTVPVRKPVRTLDEGAWTPFVRIKEKGNIIILNPWCEDLEGQVSIYNPLRNPVADGEESYEETTVMEEPVGDLTADVRIQVLNKNTLALISQNAIKLLYRNQDTQRFESGLRIEKENQYVVGVSCTDFELLNQFQKYFNKKWFTNVTKQDNVYLIRENLDKWVAILSRIYTKCDRLHSQSINSGGISVSQQLLKHLYRILGTIVEQLKPYLKNIDQSHISTFDKLAQWSISKIFFKISETEQIPSSVFQNSLPALRLANIQNIVSTDKYIMVQYQSLLTLFNYQVVPFKIMEIDMRKGTTKATEVEKYTEVIEKLKKSNELQPSIYKILSNCLTEAKKVKPIPPKAIAPNPPVEKKETKQETKKQKKQKADDVVDQKLVDELLAMGFEIKKIRKALIHTKSSSLQATLEYLFNTPDEPVTKPTLSEWSCEVCTLINKNTDKCQACDSPMPQVKPVEVEAPKVKVEKVQEAPKVVEQFSQDISQELQCFSFCETGHGAAPLIVVACFEKTIRIRLLAHNPSYFGRFSIRNEKGFIDLSNMSLHESTDTINQQPLVLERLFVGEHRGNSSTYGWISVEDEDHLIASRPKSVKMSRTKNGVEAQIETADGTKFINVNLKQQSIYNPKAKAIQCSFKEAGHQILKDISENSIDIVRHSNDVQTIPNRSTTIYYVFSQATLKNPVKPNDLPNNVVKSEGSYESGNGFLPLLIEQAPPGCNMHYPVCSILYPSNQSFLANYPYRIVMRHMHGKMLQIDSVMLERIGANKNVKMMKSGYIYLLNDMNKQPNSRHYFEFSSTDKKIQVDIKEKQPYRYLVVEPIYKADSNDNIPFEIGFVGAVGRGIENFDQTVQPINVLKSLKAEVTGVNKDSSEPVQYSIQQFLVNDRRQIKYLSQKLQEAYVAELLKNNIPVDILVRITPKTNKFDKFIVNKIDADELWSLVDQWFEITQKSEKSKETDNDLVEANIAEFVGGNHMVLSSLHALSKNNKHVWQKFIKSIGAGRFLEEIVLKCPKKDSIIMLEIVECVGDVIPEEDVKNLLEKLKQKQQTVDGLKIIFRLADVKNINSQLNDLMVEALKMVETRKPQYRSLRKAGNYHLSLEDSLFSDYYFNLVQKQRSDSESIFQNTHFMSKFVVVKSRFSRKYIIDLTNQVRVHNILLSFDKSDSRIKMLIRIYRVDQKEQPKNIVVFQEYLQESSWIQMVKNAYIEPMSKIFNNPLKNGLNSLGISGLDFDTRYLIIDISFTILPNIGDQREIENLPTNEIIPEIYGEYSGQLDPLFPEYFNFKPTDLKYFSNVQFHDISRLAKYSFVRDYVEYLYYDNEDNMPVQQEPKRKRNYNEMTLNTVKSILSLGSSKQSLDYAYTILCLLFDTTPKNDSKLLIEIFNLLVKNQRGPISEKAISFIRKSLKNNDELYLTLLRQSHSVESFSIFKELPVKQNIIKKHTMDESKEFVKNVLVLARQSQIEDEELLKTLIRQAIKHNFDEIATQLLKQYSVDSQILGQVIQSVSQKSPQQARQLIKMIKDRRHLVNLAEESLESNSRMAELIINEVATLSVPEECLQKLSLRMIKLYSQRDHEKDLILLSKIFRNAKFDSRDFIRLFLRSKHKSKLQSQFFSLEIIKKQENQNELLKHVSTMVKIQENSTFLIDLLAHISGDTTYDFFSDNYKTKCHGDSAREIGLVFGTVLKRLNLGGIDNTKITTQQTRFNIIVANYLCCILLASGPDIDAQSLQQIISWFFLNNVDKKKSSSYRSYTSQRFYKLTTNTQTLIEQFMKKSTKSVVKTCFDKYREIKQELNKIRNGELFSQVESTLLRGFKTVILPVLQQPQILTYYMCDLDGFSNMVDNINNYGNSENKEISEKERVNELKMQNGPKDWLVNKAGNGNNTVYKVTYSNDVTKKAEIVLESEKGILPTKLAIGLVVTETPEKTNILPRQIEVYTGQDKDSVEFVSSLQIIEDDFYASMNKRVYGFNFLQPTREFNNIGEYFDWLSNLQPIHYIKLSFQRPQLVSLCDITEVAQRNDKNNWTGISFMSFSGLENTQKVMGNDIANSVHLLTLLSQKSHQPTLQKILSEPKNIQILKQSLNIICDVMTNINCQRFFHTFIKVLSQQNEQLGDYIIDRYLACRNSVVYANIVGDIVCSNRSASGARLQKLHNFVMSELCLGIHRAIIPFMQKLTDILHIVMLDQQKHSGQHPQNIILSVNSSDIVKIIELAYGDWQQFQSDIVRYALVLTLIKQPFRLSEDILPVVLDHSIKHSKYINLLSALLLGSDKAADTYIKNKHLQGVFDGVLAFMKMDKMESTLTAQLRFLAELCNSKKFKEIVNEEELNVKLFKNAIRNQEQLGSTLSKDLRKELVNFIVTSTVGTAAEKTIARLLKQSLESMSAREGSQYLMEMEVFLPILNSFNHICVCFEGYNQTQRKFLKNANNILLRDAEKSVDETVSTTGATAKPIDSSLLTKDMENKLMTLLPNNFESQLITTKIVETETDFKFKTRLFENNFLLIAQGRNNNGKLVTAGAYYSAESGFPKGSINNGVMWGRWNNNCFIFYYENNGQMTHFRHHPSENQPFVEMESDGDSGEISVLLKEQQVICINFKKSQTSTIDFGHNFENEEKVKIDGGREIIFIRGEIWQVRAQKQQKKNQKNETNKFTKELIGSLQQCHLLSKKMLADRSAVQLLRSSPVFMVPGEMKVRGLKKLISVLDVPLDEQTAKNIELFTNAMGTKLNNDATIEEISNGPIMDIQFVAQDLFNENMIQNLLANGMKKEPIHYDFLPKKGIFKAFEDERGVEQLIEAVSSRIVLWKNQERAKKWLQYIQELKSFSCLPFFFSMYMKEKQSVGLLLNLLVGLPDREDQQKWQQMEFKSSKQLYKIVAQVLLVDKTQKFRDQAIKSKLITTILDRLQLLCKEEKRKFIKDYQEKEESVPANSPNKPTEENQKAKKKKGVGYGTDSSSNPKWVTQQKTDTKKQYDQIYNILEILGNFFNTSDWKVPTTLVEEVKCSCLLPLIETTLRAGTLLEISKDPQGIKQILKVISMLTKHRVLIPCLLELPKNYQPAQVQSVYSLLKALDNTSRIFLSCIGSQTADTNKSTEAVAKQLMDTFKLVEQAVEDYRENDDDSAMNNILELPLDKKYKELLKDLRFDYISMRDANGKLKHHYSSSSNSQTVNSNKMVRLAQELADLSTSLPIAHTNSIFVRCDKTRMDFMQALIMGSNGTPYGHGAYLFDIYFDDSYPNGPPKVNLMTTGSAKVRFNPNLYACGKVCLSLLGTWRGHATENWDPKVSTLLQVLVSIQAIIMSEDIYFNQPGFEGQQGTDEGEKKNEAYSNIVRYCNIKFAMIENMKHPPVGFQTIIRRHFYLKKDEILKEVEEWVKLSQKREASYIGLVNDHNSSWSQEFKKSKTRYNEMLTAAVTQLTEELNKLAPPSIHDIESKKTSPKKKKQPIKPIQETIKNEKEGAADLNDIDVSYDQSETKNKELSFEDQKVKDRWSRYIGAMGIDAVNKQSKASVFILGLGPFALQVVKNIVLSGCKQIALYDSTLVTMHDLSGGFFYGESDIGKKRLQASLYKIQELNQYVKIIAVQAFDKQMLKGYDVVLATETPIDQQIEIDSFCRTNKIKFISADCIGPYAKLFNDFGEKFEVLDKNGQETTEVMIKNITIAEKAVVTLLEGAKHPFEDDDVIIIKGVDGMEVIDKPVIQGQEELKSINGSLHKIQTINSNSFRIGSTLAYKPYVRNGTAKNLKLPVLMEFPSLADVNKVSLDKLPIDQNLSIYDFVKMGNSKLVHGCILTLDTFKKDCKSTPRPWNLDDANKFLDIFQKQYEEKLDEKDHRFIKIFSMVCTGNLPPLCAFWGGFVSQQIIKAITQKYKPTKSYFYCEFSELIQDLPEDTATWPETLKAIEVSLSKTRTIGFETVVGKQLKERIEQCKLFMIGAGAIGCELLKNFAMINLGVSEKGGIVLTDPDHIETSNLNRQFLFREKHIRKPKSSTAAASVIQMNPQLKGHIVARLDKVHDGTKEIFNNVFFKSLTIVANALDNVQARRYVDQRCVDNKIPLLESGTLGPKGHVQVIVPYLTESYGSKNDPVEEGEIPHCTLKMFPEETLHCVEWARDKFGHKFSLKPKALTKVLDEKYKPDASEKKTLNNCLKMLKKKPTNFDECIEIALKKFYKYYRNDVKQLLYTYPLDAKTKNGEPFWKLPKRPPTPIEQFNPEDILHCTFVTSYAVLLAKSYNIAYPKNFRSNNERFDIGKYAAKIKIQPFVPSDKKAKSIMNESEKKEGQEEEPTELVVEENQQEIYERIKKLQSKEINISAQEFEKDDDANGHIDFIHSMANLRSINYKLEPMDWITTKIKAGRIVPALSTTTTAIAGLQTLQLCKYLKGVKIDKMRNAFLNLAVPVVQLSEPGQVEKIKLTPQLSFTIWDRWEVKCNDTTTLQDLFANLESTYKLKPRDVFQQSSPVYLSVNMDIAGKEKQKEELLSTKLVDLLQKQENNIDLIVTFSHLEDNKIINNTPTIRLLF